LLNIRHYMTLDLTSAIGKVVIVCSDRWYQTRAELTAALFIGANFYTSSQEVVLTRGRSGGTKGCFSPPTVVVCRIVDTDFREFIF
jgi:hypothetical protein